MTSEQADLSIVIPVHNGEDALPCNLTAVAAWRRRQTRRTEVVLVDDGSGPAAARVLRDFVAGGEGAGFTLLRHDPNRGKGYAVVRGMLAATGRHRVFTDADLAYPIEEAAKVVAQLEAGSDVAVACRVLPESRYLMSPSFFHYLYTRHLMSRAFNWAVRLTLLPGILDSQAGLKGMTAAAAETVLPRLTIPGFGFDVELLYVARRLGLRVTQAAVNFRYDSEPTTVRFAGDAITMLGDLLRIRWNSLRGRYR